MATFLKTALAVLVLAISGDARITRLVVEHTATAGHDGYQKLTGHAYGELDPRTIPGLELFIDGRNALERATFDTAGVAYVGIGR